MSLAALLPVERQLESMRGEKISSDPRRRATLETRLAERVLELNRQFLAVSGEAQDRWSVSARCRVGRVYEEYGRVMAGFYQEGRAPAAVRRLGKDAVAQHHQQVSKIARQKVAPLEQMALKSYRGCLRAADEHQLTSRYILEARARVEALQRKVR